MQDQEAMIQELVDADVILILKIVEQSLFLLEDMRLADSYLGKLCPIVISQAFELSVMSTCEAHGAPRPVVQAATIQAITEMLTKHAERFPEEVPE